MTSGRLTFPLVPRRWIIGPSFGTMRSRRRGSGSEIAGSRRYQPGDDVGAIDWAASARISTATGRDEFVVRERFKEDVPRIVIASDRRPQMSFFGGSLPWLDKPRAAAAAVELILSSTASAGGFAGYLDHADGTPYWRQPKGGPALRDLDDERLSERGYAGPADWLEQTFAHIAAHTRAVTPGTFVFLLSDFVPVAPEDVWLAALERRWDLVPVVLQDPTWERSFPDASGIAVPLLDARTGRVVHVRLTRKEARERRAAHRARFVELLETFRLLDLDPVFVSSHDPGAVLESFLLWSSLRKTRRVVGA